MIEMYDWIVQVDRPPYTQEVRLYIYRNQPNGEQQFLVNGGPVFKIVKKDGARKKENLCFAVFPDDHVASLALVALEHKGIDLPSKDQVFGKLEATERHLDDMRRLVFEPQQEIQQQIIAPKMEE